MKLKGVTMGTTTTIPLDVGTRDRIKLFGHKDESYDAILNRLLDAAGYDWFLERQHNALYDKKKFVSLDDLDD